MAKKSKFDLKSIWKFIWEDDSLLSYIVFVLLAFVLLRFMVFPGFLFLTGYSDVAAVMTSSMEHGETIKYTFNDWLEFNNFSEEEVNSWPYLDGLNVGDVIAVKKVPAEEIEVGDVILFYTPKGQIIHRVVDIKNNETGYYFTTKGDANGEVGDLEIDTPYSQVKGKLVNKVPYLGYPKVLFSYLISF